MVGVEGFTGALTTRRRTVKFGVNIMGVIEVIATSEGDSGR
jgi:hypothetical protein